MAEFYIVISCESSYFWNCNRIQEMQALREPLYVSFLQQILHLTLWSLYVPADLGHLIFAAAVSVRYSASLVH